MCCTDLVLEMMQATEFFQRVEFMEELSGFFGRPKKLYITVFKTETVEITHVMNHSATKWSPSIFALVSQMG